MMAYVNNLKERIIIARQRATQFFESLWGEEYGWRYTSNHNAKKYPSATLYGTWSAILGLQLLKQTNKWTDDYKKWAIARLTAHRQSDGAFLGTGLHEQKNAKSLEYLILHCTNYSLGAALELDPNFDFETQYFHRFLDGDTLSYWLDGRSLSRPWEEGNNIVNVASYLALCHTHGISKADERLSQLLEWHRKYQNPKTGGFDRFTSPSSKQRLEALAGAVHNFHLHLYLGESLGYEERIASALPKYLMLGRLTACLSIDFVELAIRTLSSSNDPQALVWALICHSESLLQSQRSDGGWLEAADNATPTTAAGFKDNGISSCSYATWFRLASLAMISIVLLGDEPSNWRFRNTLGMGYAPSYWPTLPAGTIVEPPPLAYRLKMAAMATPVRTKNTLIRIASKFLG